MSTILGITGIETCADILEDVLADRLSVPIMFCCDSNGIVQSGFSQGISHGLERAGLKKIASNPLIGLFINGGSGRGAWLDETHISVQAGVQGDYALMDPGIHPFLPHSADGPTLAAIQAVSDNRPSCFRGGTGPGGPNMATPFISINQSDTPTLGHNIFEPFDVMIPYVSGPGQGSRRSWCRSTNGVTYFDNFYADATPDHAGASFRFEEGFIGSMNGGTPGTAVRVGDTSLQIMPHGANFGHTGEGIILSAFIRYRERSHGYCAGFLSLGAVGVQVHSAGLAAYRTQWIDSQIRAMASAVNGRAAWLVLWITLGLHNRAANAPNHTQAVYRAGLDGIIDLIDARFTALKDAGSIPGTMRGVMVVADVCGFRIPVPPNASGDLDHCYAAANEKAAARGRMVVMDNRPFITNARSAAICTDGSHLNSAGDYKRIAADNISRLVMAARKANSLARIS